MGENAPKIVIVVLVIVAVLFFVGVGVGANGQNNGQGGLPGVSVEGAINTFAGLIPAPTVAPSEISSSSGCFSASQRSITVANFGGCTLEIADSDANIRSLKLKINPGQRVHLESTSNPVEDKPLLTKANLAPGGTTEITLNFFKENGSITISNCIPGSGSVCILTIAD